MSCYVATKRYKVSNLDLEHVRSVMQIINNNWDSFCVQGASRPMFDFDFFLDTGDSKPICYRQRVYCIHKQNIINTHIQILEENDWICDYESAWGSLLVLAPRPHQEGCTNINDIILRLCVSYRSLNGVTNIFEYPISRCSDNIEDFGDFSGRISFIDLDARSGYHQIRVCKIGQEKLAFFKPNSTKKTFKVMTFGPKNAPAFYTAMMQFLWDNQLLLFNETRYTISFDHSPT